MAPPPDGGNSNLEDNRNPQDIGRMFSCALNILRAIGGKNQINRKSPVVTTSFHARYGGIVLFLLMFVVDRGF